MKYLRNLICLGLVSCGFLFSEEIVGTCVAIQGIVIGKRAGFQDELLEKGAQVFLKNTIVVEVDSRAQLKLTDGSLLNLIPQTIFSIESYVLEHRGEKKGFFGNLTKGGLRGISGSIAKSKPDNFVIKTPTATMGLRGTIFSVNIVGDQTYFSCESGSISVSNSEGQVLLGPHESQQYATVSQDSSPLPLPKRPDALRFSNFIAPSGSSCN